MEIIRQLLVLLVTISFSGFLLWHVAYGIKNGKIHHTDSTQIYSRKDNPLKFWALVILFMFFASASLWLDYRSLLN
jgi:hypothetical protein